MPVDEEKEKIMISSPCKNCPKRNQPKDKCLKECRLLQAIQDIHISIKEDGEDWFTPAIDYAEEGRFSINSRQACWCRMSDFRMNDSRFNTIPRAAKYSERQTSAETSDGDWLIVIWFFVSLKTWINNNPQKQKLSADRSRCFQAKELLFDTMIRSPSRRQSRWIRSILRFKDNPPFYFFPEL